MQNNKILRNSKVELLRIIAMMGIVLVHYLNGRMGGALSNINDGYNYYLIHFFESLGILSVNIWLFCSIGRTKYGNWYLFHVPLDNEPLSMRYSVSEAAADESLLPCIQPITSTSHCKVAFAA